MPHVFFLNAVRPYKKFDVKNSLKYCKIFKYGYKTYYFSRAIAITFYNSLQCKIDQMKGEILMWRFIQVYDPIDLHVSFLLWSEMDFRFYRNSKLVLIGSDHHQNFDSFATNEAIQCTEIFEYAQKLNNPDFCMITLVYYKFLYIIRCKSLSVFICV